MERLESSFAATGNPICAWLAVRRITRDGRADLPEWVLVYLREASHEVMRLAMGHTHYTRPLPRS